MTKKAKHSKGFSVSVMTLVAFICSLLLVITYFLPFVSYKSNLLENSSDTGLDLTEALFNSEPISEDLKGILVAVGIDVDQIQFGAFATALGAFSCIIIGGLLLIAVVLGVLLKNKTVFTVGKVIACAGVIFSILTLVGAIILSGKVNLGTKDSIIYYLTNMGVSVFVYLIGSIGAAAALVIDKK